MATECLLCLEVNKQIVNCIEVNSTQWKEHCIEGIIEKHLWPLATLKSNSSWLCLACWDYLNDFHKFYRRIENAQHYYEGLVKMEIEIEDPKFIAENLIIPETVLTEDACHNNDTNETYESSEHFLETEKTIEGEDESTTKYEDMYSYNTKADRNPLEVSQTDGYQIVEVTKTNIDNISLTGKDNDETNPIDGHLLVETLKYNIEEDHQEKSTEVYDNFIAQHFKLTCNICQHTSETFLKLRQHFAAMHKPQDPFVYCCGRKIKRPRCLYEHIHSHLNPDYFKCKYCPRVLKDRRNLLNHILRHEGKIAKKPKRVRSTKMNTTDDVNYNDTTVDDHGSLVIPDNANEPNLIKSECIDIQDTTIGDNSMLENYTYDSDNSNSIKESQKPDMHINVSQIPETYQPDADPQEDLDEFLAKHIQITCPLCQEACASFSKLRHHFLVEHNQQQAYILCCDRKHNRRRCIVEHIKTHLNPDYFKCKYCARVLKERRHFLNHIAVHEGSLFRCGICGKKFSDKSEFECHKMTHPRKEFSCTKCSKSYDRRCQLSRHQRTAHRGKFLRTDGASKVSKTKNASGKFQSTIVVKPETAIEADANAEEENNELAETGSQYASDNPTDVESEKSNATESEDMEKYLPSHNIKPGDYDDFLAKHIKFTCSVCQEACADFSLLRQHFAEFHNRVGYVLCCGTKHKTRSFLVDHVQTHLNPEYFKCETCSKVFKGRRGLILHIALHKGKIYRCKICKRTFLDKTKLKKHKSTHRSKKRQRFPCPECGKTFGDKALLSYHQKAMHLNMFVKLCDICGVTFRGSECFKKHMEKHKGCATDTFPCEICGRILAGKQTLKLHKMAVHPEGGILPYSCHICNKLEATKSRLNSHIRKAHVMSYDYKCTICERAFKQSKSLKSHMVVHTGEPLFTCTWCTKTFNSSGNLSSHRQRAHPSEYKEWKKQNYLGDLPSKFKSKTNP